MAGSRGGEEVKWVGGRMGRWQGRNQAQQRDQAAGFAHQILGLFPVLIHEDQRELTPAIALLQAVSLQCLGLTPMRPLAAKNPL